MNCLSVRGGDGMGRFSKKIVGLVVGLNVAFTAAVFYAFLKVGSEPTALITAWFAFTTGELWMLAGIRKAKLKHKAGDGDGV